MDQLENTRNFAFHCI